MSSKEIECHFSVQIKAPGGLENITPHLKECRLKLATHKSGFNGKVILKSVHGDEVEWAMDSSDNEILFASGYVYDDIDNAGRLLNDLSIALVSGGYPHEIIIDDVKNETSRTSTYLWPNA